MTDYTPLDLRCVPCPACAAPAGAACEPTGPARSIPSVCGGWHPARRARCIAAARGEEVLDGQSTR